MCTLENGIFNSIPQYSLVSVSHFDWLGIKNWTTKVGGKKAGVSEINSILHCYQGICILHLSVNKSCVLFFVFFFFFNHDFRKSVAMQFWGEDSQLNSPGSQKSLRWPTIDWKVLSRHCFFPVASFHLVSFPSYLFPIPFFILYTSCNYIQHYCLGNSNL